MQRTFRSSGDLLADRRFLYAEDLAAEGSVEASGDLLQQVLERVPDWVPAWLALGAARQRQGLAEAAREAFAQAACLDTSGLYGAVLSLARSSSGADVPTMPAAYVAALFDDYAPRFDAHLVKALGYRGPDLLAAALAETCGERRFEQAADLGCGTGLMAAPIRSRVTHLVGIDLSPGMIDMAERRDLYDRLIVGDIVACLGAMSDRCLDLIVAADVFAYVGPLRPVIAAAARTLRPEGVLAFTVQRHEGTAPQLGADLRFSHSQGDVADAIEAGGLISVLYREASTRRERGVDVPGLVVVARRP